MTLDEYTRERDLMLSDREQRRVHLVHELLAGNDVDPPPWGTTRPDPTSRSWPGATPRPRRLGWPAPRWPARSWWSASWMTRPGAGWAVPPRRDTTQRLARADLPGGAALAFGEDAAGTGGFVQSHEQARRAERAGRRSGRPITHYADVALESLAAVDEDAATAFVARELAGLDGDDVRSTRLRQTLRAWFAAGHNAAAAAAALGVHEQTVAQRLRTVEERTGRPVAARRAELETALRLRDLLG